MARRTIASSAYFLVLLATGVVLLDLLVVALVGLSLQFSREQYEERAMVATQNLAHLLEREIATTIDKIELGLLAAIDEINAQVTRGGIDGHALDEYIARRVARQPELESLRFANAQGIVLYGTGVESGNPTNITDREYFARLRDDLGAGLVISDPVLGRISGKWVIVLARRVSTPDGNFGGTVFATISLARFQNLFSTLNLGPHGAVSLRDTQLGLVARFAAGKTAGAAVGSKSVSRQLQEVVRSNPGGGTYVARTKMDNIERANAYRKVDKYPFYVIVGLATDDFLAHWRHEAFKFLALTVVFVVATFILSWLIYRSWKLREALSQRVVAVQEEERRRLAAELHDYTSPNLAALSLNLGMIAEDLPAEARAALKARLADTQALLVSTTKGIRDACAYLRPAALDYTTLANALREYAEQFSRRTGIEVNVAGPVTEERLEPDTESLLFRIGQEALTNAAKHAKASAIKIELTYSGTQAALAISDNGTGFEPELLGRSEHRPGLGLLTMRDRVELVGGRFGIESQPGKGTRIRAEVYAKRSPHVEGQSG